MSDYALEISELEVLRYTMMAELARESEGALWERAGIVPGALVVDVGCGPAAVSVCMARIVAPSGRVIGVEPDERSRVAAAQILRLAAVENLEVRSGTAADSGVPPESADVAVLRHVLAHNGGVEQELVEHVAALVRPGGCVFLVDIEATGNRALDGDPDLLDLEHKYVDFQTRRGNDMSVGLRLGRLLEGAGLHVVAFEGRYWITSVPPGVRPPSWAARDAMLAEGGVSSDDVERWTAAFARGDAASLRPTIFAPTFFAIGRKPPRAA